MVARAHLPGCVVSDSKISDYLLSEHHKEGRSKARFFLALGFSLSKRQVLSDSLIEHAVRNEIAERVENAWGTKFIVRCSFNTPDGRNPCIVTVWIEQANSPPRLVTAYPGS